MQWRFCASRWRKGACMSCLACVEPPAGDMLQPWQARTVQAPRIAKNPKLGPLCCVRRTSCTCRKSSPHGSMLTAGRTHPPSFRGSRREKATPGRKTPEDRSPLPAFDADGRARTWDRRGQGGRASVACSRKHTAAPAARRRVDRNPARRNRPCASRRHAQRVARLPGERGRRRCDDGHTQPADTDRRRLTTRGRTVATRGRP